MSNGHEPLLVAGRAHAGVEQDAALRGLLMDVLLIDASEYRDSAGPDQIAAWDSLAMVEIAAAVEACFGYAIVPEELIEIRSIGDIKALLRARDVAFLG